MNYKPILRSFTLYCSYLIKERGIFIKSTLMQVGIILCNLIFPLTLASLIAVISSDVTLINESNGLFSKITESALQFGVIQTSIVLFISLFAIDATRNYLQVAIQNVFDTQAGSIYKDIMANAIRSFLSKPFLDRQASNIPQLQGLMPRLYYSCLSLQSGLIGRVIPITLEALIALGALVFIFGYLYGLLFLALIACFVGYSFAFSKRTDQAQGEYNSAFSNSVGELGDILKHHEQIVSLGGVAESQRQVERELNKLHKSYLSSLSRLKTFFSMQSITIYSAAYLIIGYSLYQILNTELHVTALVLLTTYLFQFSAPLNTIGFFIKNGINNLYVIAEVVERLGLSEKSAPSPKPIIREFKKIKVKSLNFSYHKIDPLVDKAAFCKTPLLNDVNVEIPTGIHIAIIGSNGSGKSTFSRILGGQIEPDSGSIYLGDIDLFSLPMSERTKLVRYVPQSGSLFAKCILSNLAYPDSIDELDSEKTLSVLKDLDEQLFSRIYDGTSFNQNAEALSGGEVQKILMARALLHPAKIMIFDESTSDMDQQSQARIKHIASKWLPNSTVLFVTHSREFADTCDAALLIKDGETCLQYTSILN